MTASAGARIEISSTGIRLYNSASVVKAHMDPATGQSELLHRRRYPHLHRPWSAVGAGERAEPDHG